VLRTKFRRGVASNFDLPEGYFYNSQNTQLTHRQKIGKYFSIQCSEISRTVIRQFLAAEYENQIKKFRNVAPLCTLKDTHSVGGRYTSAVQILVHVSKA
jgi:hypothetical protein